MKLAILMDKNGVELKNGDLVQYENYKGINEGNQDRVVVVSGKWYIETVPNPKGTLFELDNFPTKEITSEGKIETIILKTYKKVEKGGG